MHLEQNMDYFEQAARDVDETWHAVGKNMLTAMQEIATEVGGEDFAAKVTETAAFGPDSILPDVDALKLIKQRNPEAATHVAERAEAIAKAEREREKAEMLEKLRQQRPQYDPRAILGGFAALGEGMALLGRGISQPFKRPHKND